MVPRRRGPTSPFNFHLGVGEVGGDLPKLPCANTRQAVVQACAEMRTLVWSC